MKQTGLVWWVWMLLVVPTMGEVVDLSGQSWRIWLDREAAWHEDTLWLPPVDLANVAVQAPSCGWEVLYGKQGREATLPATVEEFYWGDGGHAFGLSGDYRGVSWFVTEFMVEEAWRDKRLVLDFESVRLRAEVFVNERLVGYDLIGGTPFSVNIRKAVKAGQKNHLAVRITDPGGAFSRDGGDALRWGDYELPPSLGFGGITGGVRLHVTDQAYIEDVFIKNRPEGTMVDVEMTLRNEEVMPTHGTLSYRVIPYGGGKPLAKGKEKINALAGQQVLSKQLNVKRAKLWSPENPQLYTLELSWQGENGTSHEWNETFAFRWFEVRTVEEDRQFFLNGKRFMLRGAASKGYWPLNGMAASSTLAGRQVESVKALGLNFLQCQGGVAQKNVFQATDELGILCSESPEGYGWGGTSDFAKAYQREALLRMVKRDRHHPSLVMYQMVYDAGRDPLEHEYLDMVDMHKLDETRMIHFTTTRFSAAFYGECPQEAAPVKLHMLPYDQEPQQQGWWSCLGEESAGVYQDYLYRGPEEFLGKQEHGSEIVFQGEQGALGALPRLQLIKDSLVQEKRLGWDGQSYLSRFKAFDRFLTEKGFRDAFPSVDALCLSVGAILYDYHGRCLENSRIQSTVDGYEVEAWEDNKFENQAGLVDVFRFTKGDPNILAHYNQALYVAVKCRQQVMAVDSDTVVDFYLVNDVDLQGEMQLHMILEDDRGVYVEKDWPVDIMGGGQFGQQLKTDITVPTRTAGYTTIKAELRQGKKVFASGRERVYTLAYDPNEFTGSVAVWDTSQTTQGLLKKLGIKEIEEYESKRPQAKCLVVGADIPKLGLDSVLDWVIDGHTFLIVTQQADAWAQSLADKGMVDYRGKRVLKSGAAGGHYFVRQHPLFTALPVNTAFNWEYQSLANTDRQRFGLRLHGEQCIVGCYTDHQPEVLTAVGIIALGRGQIILSTLDLAAAIDSGERAGLVAQQILLNYLQFSVTQK